MHPDLATLLDLQEKDLALLDVDRRLQAALDEHDALDQELARRHRAREVLQERVTAIAKEREALETRIESLRAIQEARRGRMEHVKTAREAQALTTELDMARSIIAREEGEWLKLADQVSRLEHEVRQAGEAAAAVEVEQEMPRTGLAERETALQAEREAILAERDAIARRVGAPLLARYERLRSVRATAVIVAMHGTACGACHTAVPMSRRNQIRSATLIEGCEGCGVLLYYAENGA